MMQSTPGVDVVLRALAPSAQPHSVAVREWTFSGIVADVAELANYLADRLGWPDSRGPDMSAHLARQAKPDAGGYRLDIPRRSEGTISMIASPGLTTSPAVCTAN